MASSVVCDLPFTHSTAVACTPMNSTFERVQESYPYSIWIIGIGAGVVPYTMGRDYPEDEPFQYLVPNRGDFPAALHIAVSDSLGNGNTCKCPEHNYLFSALPHVETPIHFVSSPLKSGLRPSPTAESFPILPSENDSCASSSRASDRFFAFDSQPESEGGKDYAQCELVRIFIPEAETRSTPPNYTFTWSPFNESPKTINIPASALTDGGTSFSYLTPTPFAAVTQLQVAAGDSLGGGNGGSSDEFSVLQSKDSSCFQPDHRFENLDTSNALPAGGSTPQFLSFWKRQR